MRADSIMEVIETTARIQRIIIDESVALEWAYEASKFETPDAVVSILHEFFCDAMKNKFENRLSLARKRK